MNIGLLVNMGRKLYSSETWNSALSGTINTSNGVKHGGVFAPLLFTIYLDQLIYLLRIWESDVI